MSKNRDSTANKKLSEKEVLAILSTPDTFATYLATLSPPQVREYKKLLLSIPMDENVRKALSALLDLAELESAHNEEEYRRKLLPEAENLALCVKLFEQIKTLEFISASL